MHKGNTGSLPAATVGALRKEIGEFLRLGSAGLRPCQHDDVPSLFALTLLDG